MRDPTQTAISDDALPLVAPQPSNFVSSGTFPSLGFYNADEVVNNETGEVIERGWVSASIDSVSVISVPEPSGSALLLIGGVGLLQRRRDNHSYR